MNGKEEETVIQPDVVGVPVSKEKGRKVEADRS